MEQDAHRQELQCRNDRMRCVFCLDKADCLGSGKASVINILEKKKKKTQSITSSSGAEEADSHFF